MIELAVPVIAYGCGGADRTPPASVVVVGGSDEHTDGATAQRTAGIRACSNASQVSSSAIRCCGSMLSASIFDSAKNSASKPLMSDRYPPRVWALATRSAIRGSERNSSQRRRADR
jgi:hypothetical protein